MNPSSARLAFFPILSLLFLAPAAALFAHTGEDATGGFLSGLKHPVLGPDHVIAMVAIGLWGAQLGKPSIWLLPVVFPLIMAVGGALGVAGVPLPGIEIGIAVSGIILGLMILFQVKAPVWVAVLLAGGFAIFHGHAHGGEMPQAASAVAYSIGFVIGTGLLHLCGILLGLLLAWKGTGPVLVRALGGAIAAAGLYFLVSIFMEAPENGNGSGDLETSLAGLSTPCPDLS